MILRPRAKRAIFSSEAVKRSLSIINGHLPTTLSAKRAFLPRSHLSFRKFIVMRYSRCAGGKFLYNPRAAGVAQLVEQLICNQ